MHFKRLPSRSSTEWTRTSLQGLHYVINPRGKEQIEGIFLRYTACCAEDPNGLEFCVGDGRGFKVIPQAQALTKYVTDWNRDTLSTIRPKDKKLLRIHTELSHLDDHVADLDFCYGFHGFDTMPTADRGSSLEALYSALKPGGFLFHFMDSNTFLERISEVAHQRGITSAEYVCVIFVHPGARKESDLVFIPKSEIKLYRTRVAHLRENLVEQVLGFYQYIALDLSPKESSPMSSFFSTRPYTKLDALLSSIKPGSPEDKLKDSFVVVNLGMAFSDLLASGMQDVGFELCHRVDSPDAHIIVAQKPTDTPLPVRKRLNTG